MKQRLLNIQKWLRESNALLAGRVQGQSRYAVKRGNRTPADWQRRDQALAQALNGLTFIEGYYEGYHISASFLDLCTQAATICFIAQNTTHEPIRLTRYHPEGDFILVYHCWDSSVTKIDYL